MAAAWGGIGGGGIGVCRAGPGLAGGKAAAACGMGGGGIGVCRRAGAGGYCGGGTGVTTAAGGGGGEDVEVDPWRSSMALR